MSFLESTIMQWDSKNINIILKYKDLYLQFQNLCKSVEKASRKRRKSAEKAAQKCKKSIKKSVAFVAIKFAFGSFSNSKVLSNVIITII